MRRLLSSLLLTVAFLFISYPAHPCGDKLLVLGRPLRFNSRPAAILAFAPPGSSMEMMLNSSQWTVAITKGRHRLQVVQTTEEIARSLKDERFDVILAGSAQAVALRSQLAITSSPAVFVPVVNKSLRDAFRTAEKEYGVAMKDPAKSGDYLAAIGRAVDLHDRRMEAVVREKKRSGKSS